MADQTQTAIEGEVLDVIKLQDDLAALEAELNANEVFQRFIELQRTFNDRSSEVWKKVEQQMIENNIKSIKGDWGSLTIAERTNYKAEDLEAVPRKFIKRTLDTTKVGAAAKLEGKLPKGITSSKTQYLTKRLKARSE